MWKISVFLLVLVMVLGMAVSSFAVEIPSIPNDGNPYYVVKYHSDGRVLLYTSVNQATAEYSVSYQDFVLRIAGNSKTYVLTGQIWSLNSSYTTEITTTSGAVLASNYNINFIDGSGVFFSPPIVNPLVEAMNQNQNQMNLQIVGLIPYLIGFLIVLVAFWKGWRFLLQQLRTV